MIRIVDISVAPLCFKNWASPFEIFLGAKIYSSGRKKRPTRNPGDGGKTPLNRHIGPSNLSEILFVDPEVPPLLGKKIPVQPDRKNHKNRFMNSELGSNHITLDIPSSPSYTRFPSIKFCGRGNEKKTYQPFTLPISQCSKSCPQAFGLTRLPSNGGYSDRVFLMAVTSC